jgi:hypothetical protein
MAIDDEGQKLIDALVAIEDRYLSNATLVDCLRESLKTLHVIFDGNEEYAAMLETIRSANEIDDIEKHLDALVIAAPPTITVKKGGVGSPLRTVKIYRNSCIMDFLVHNGRLRSPELRQFHQFFVDCRGGQLEEAFRTKDSSKVKSMLKEFISILEREEQFLHDNLHRLASDDTYALSVQKLFIHEVVHWVTENSALQANAPDSNILEAIDEAYSFSLQLYGTLFRNPAPFTHDRIRTEISKLYRLTVPRKHAYSSYSIMKGVFPLIGAMVLCDAISRSYGDETNKLLFFSSYRAVSVFELYRICERMIDNLHDDSVRYMLRSTLITTAGSQLKKATPELQRIAQVEIDGLPSKNRPLSFDFWSDSPAKEWASLIDFIKSPELMNSIKKFSLACDLLVMIGEEALAKKYRRQFLQGIDSLVQEISLRTQDGLFAVYTKESDTVRGLQMVLQEERNELVELLDRIDWTQ